MKIFRFKKDFRYGLGDGTRISIDLSKKKGDIIFKPTDESELVDSYHKMLGLNNYWPADGSYAMSDERLGFVENLELVDEVQGKPLDYFLYRKYSEYDIDKMNTK